MSNMVCRFASNLVPPYVRQIQSAPAVPPSFLRDSDGFLRDSDGFVCHDCLTVRRTAYDDSNAAGSPGGMAEGYQPRQQQQDRWK